MSVFHHDSHNLFLEVVEGLNCCLLPIGCYVKKNDGDNMHVLAMLH